MCTPDYHTGHGEQGGANKKQEGLFMLGWFDQSSLVGDNNEQSQAHGIMKQGSHLDRCT